MFLSPNTNLQLSFKDPCTDKLNEYTTSQVVNLITSTTLQFIQKRPTNFFTYQYYLYDYPLASSLNMHVS